MATDREAFVEVTKFLANDFKKLNTKVDRLIYMFNERLEKLEKHIAGRLDLIEFNNNAFETTLEKTLLQNAKDWE